MYYYETDISLIVQVHIKDNILCDLKGATYLSEAKAQWFVIKLEI